MTQIKNTFEKGKMNQDLDSRLIPAGEYRSALNVKVNSSASTDRGVAENNLSNLLLTSLSIGTTVETIGMFMDNVGEKIYMFVVSDLGSYVIEYDTTGPTTTIVLEDTSAGVLNFSTSNYITGVNLTVDSDNDVRLLNWTDNLNPLRQINIERAKTYGANNFTDAEISLIKPAPLASPSIVLENTIASGTQNNIEERFIRFSHRYQYLDGEFSALSPFTEVAFLPGSFSYDFDTGTNRRMVNTFNQVAVTFNVGSDLVKAVDVVFKDDQSNTVYIIDSFNKAEQSWADDSSQSIDFVNNKIFRALDRDQLLRLFDAVPLKAKSQEIISNRLVFGNYTENYNIVDDVAAAIELSYSISLVTTAISEGDATQSLKSNRDLEIGIVYVDGESRMTTVLTPSGDNTLFIPNSNADDQSEIKVTVASLAPAFASKYRFFIKQTQPDYDTITPGTFYNDDEFVWILLVGDEVNKVSKGDFIYAKADTQALLTTPVKTKILELEVQIENFLDNSPATQLAGTYMKIKPSGFRFNEDDVSFYEFSTFDASGAITTFPTLFDTIDAAVFYGVGLDDLTESGTYVGTDDIRYIIDIDATGTPDTFQWSDDNGVSYTTGVNITGGVQALSNGVQVTFAATTGHTLADQWIVSAKAQNFNNLGTDNISRAYGFFRADTTDNHNIQAGESLHLTLEEYKSTVIRNENETYYNGTTYENLEEWFYKENIQAGFFNDADELWFRRGNIDSSGGTAIFTQTTVGAWHLIVRSDSIQGAGQPLVSINSTLEMTEVLQLPIFETIPINNNSEIFYEIGRTYDIDTVNRYHLAFDGGDISQTAVLDAELTLPVFNCFSWGNGIESYKIRDTFNATNFKVSGSRALSTIEDYRENIRIASVTWSKVYEQTTNFNGLNEFNLSTANFKDLDDKYESIQKIYSRDTNLIVFQEDKVHRIPYQKNILFDTAGDGSVTQSTEIFGTEAAYSGEYGISTNPESFAFYGNAIYFTDVRRAAVCRLDLNGIIEISAYGMQDFFEGVFRANPTAKKLGAFDLYDKKYVLTIIDTAAALGAHTISFDEQVKGWTSFHSYLPSWMGSLNNQFYTTKLGQLYRQNNEANAVRNNFFGAQFNTELTYILNKWPSDIKFVKALNSESNIAFDITITSYLNDETTDITQSTITASEFDNREGKWYAYVRRNEIATDLSAKSAYGIGVVASWSTPVVTLVENVPTSLISAGDGLYNAAGVLRGTIDSYVPALNTISLSPVASIPVAAEFLYGLKDGRIEGSEIRGYNFKVALTDTGTARLEIYAVNAEVAKSFPS